MKSWHMRAARWAASSIGETPSNVCAGGVAGGLDGVGAGGGLVTVSTAGGGSTAGTAAASAEIG